MKAIQSMKKWILISMLFVGISLTVYAIAPQVFISEISVENTTTTSADIVIAHKGATALRIEIYAEDGSDYQTYTTYPGTSHPDEEDISVYRACGLLPNTLYYVMVTAGGFPDLENFESTCTVTHFAVFATLLK